MSKKKFQKLRTILFERGITYEDCAIAIGVSVATFCNKINGKSKFTVPEVKALSDYLGLTDEEIKSIFLD